MVRRSGGIDAPAGRVAVVTGAGQGIGAATAHRLAAAGDRVAVADLVEERAERVAGAIRAAGGAACGVACDVSDEVQVKALFASVDERLGPVEVLVSNAGITRDNLLHRLTLTEWRQVMDVHCQGAFLCARAAAARMVPRRRGKMVFLSSTSAKGNRGQANYATAKAGLQGLARTLAQELGPFNINVNAVAPGFVETPMTDAVAERLHLPLEEFHRQVRERIPLRRLGRPEDVAAVIHFLCSEAAAYVSGQVLTVDGARG
ncbi:MAG TPA: 3-oxoacyl-ACP reductase FabG [Candidatus Micrarchaeia archaeon]|nr:3-oxoacyl-ACP reductase FabG [Candidatus Micrarchaeia archaeon]